MQRMDTKTARMLNALTSDFYARCAASFAATRTRPWHGWQRCLGVLGDVMHSRQELGVLDLGCGTLRFEDFIADNTHARLNVYAVDSCEALLENKHNVHFTNLDIVSTLWDDTFPNQLNDVPLCNLTCAFGLMHHIPGMHERKTLLDTMLNKTISEGYILVSFWQFERDERLSRKARTATASALERYPDLQLDEGDWLLGWQDEPNALRYCHSFTDAEIDRLITHIADKAQLVDRFRADGPNDDLNCYLVLRRL